MSRIKAIQTRYKGYRFRSRLEARWAVFFDALGITWEYEKEGFDFDGIDYYLPDFWLPIQDGIWIRLPLDSDWDEFPSIKEDQGNYYGHIPVAGYWFEVKGTPPTSIELNLCRNLAIGTGHHTHLVSGYPGEHKLWKWNRDGNLVCDGEGAELDQELSELCGNDIYYHPFEATALFLGNHKCTFNTAINAARSARFEHGECP